MDNPTASASVPIQLIQGCLVASIQLDLTDDVLDAFRRDLLDRVASTRVSGVVLDVSGVDVMDSTDFESLRSTMRMVSVMGATAVIVGLKPGIVSALVALDVDTSDVVAALNLDDALRLLSQPAPVASSEGTDQAAGADTDPG